MPHALSKRSRLLFVFLIALPLLTISSNEVFGHGGGTNAEGCHTNRTTGDYHCHSRKKPSSSRATYCHVVGEEYRCGYALQTCADLVRTFGGYCAKQ